MITFGNSIALLTNSNFGRTMELESEDETSHKGKARSTSLGRWRVASGRGGRK